ncbi:helix-turn-helix domain-containing protein [Massilia oculi]|uniref:helix-turn-helix domain-containing protein n=1 Tax=Massilia oculi TaxID=945844 RepID=UPI001AAEBB70|nr:XRE family transcriptional regulator [Massilia oculi]
MNSLPSVTDPTFREKLREAREARGLSQYALAKLAGIAGVMPKRYEDASDCYATLPNVSTWNKLNAVLFPTAAQPNTGPGNAPGGTDVEPRNLLAEATIEDIVAELKRRGASAVVINW